MGSSPRRISATCLQVLQSFLYKGNHYFGKRNSGAPLFKDSLKTKPQISKNYYWDTQNLRAFFSLRYENS